MNIRQSETYRRASGAVDVTSRRTIVDQAFSLPKCVRFARMSAKSYGLICKVFAAVPGRTMDEL